MWSKDKSLFLSKALVKALFAVLIIAAFFVPGVTQWYDSISAKPPIWVELSIVLYVSLIPALILMVSLDRLLANISKGEVFVGKNVKLLRIISWCCFAAGFVYLVFGFVRYTAFLIGFVIAFMGIILRVLKNVFAEAVSLQTESDYTI